MNETKGKSPIYIVSVCIVIIIVGFLFYSLNNKKTSEQGYTEQTATTTENTILQTYTANQVATHKNSSSCWTIVRGAVYDLTKWIDMHPGGRAAILLLCGTDGTAAFLGQHDGQRDPEQELATLKIGILK